MAKTGKVGFTKNYRYEGLFCLIFSDFCEVYYKVMKYFYPQFIQLLYWNFSKSLT